MQKIFILLSILIASVCSASEELQPISYENSHEYVQKSPAPSLDMPSSIDEEFNQDDELRIMEEYDQNITDTVTPPTVSNVEVVFKNIIGSLLIRYIELREKAHFYVAKMKNKMSHWYHSIQRAIAH